MALTDLLQVSPPVTGQIRWLAGKNGISLYMASTIVVTRTTPPNYGYETVLSPVAGASGAWPAITIAQPLPPPPAWDACIAGDGTISVAYQVFGGGSNDLWVGSVADGEAGRQYGYGLYNCGLPRFLRDVSGNPGAGGMVSFVRDYRQWGLLLPQPPDKDGIVAAQFTPLVEASAGVAFGDLGKGMPSSLAVVYKTDRNTGPLSPGGLFTGKLSLAGYDLSKQALSTPTAILPEVEIAEFDAAAQAGIYCLLATTGDGALLMAAFDGAGKALGSPYLPLGPWNNNNCWAANPCIVADPAHSSDGLLGFRIACTVFEGDKPLGIYNAAVAVSPTGSIMLSTVDEDSGDATDITASDAFKAGQKLDDLLDDPQDF